MMKLLYIILILGITACSSQKEMMLGTVVPEGQAKLINDKEMFQMSRRDCDCHTRLSLSRFEGSYVPQ